MKNVLVPKIEEYNITIDQLKGTFQDIFEGFVPGAELFYSDGPEPLGTCMLWFTNSNKIPSCVPSELITFIGEYSICFHIPSDDSNDILLDPFESILGTYYFLSISGAEYKENNSTNWPFSLDFSGTGRSTPPFQCEHQTWTWGVGGCAPRADRFATLRSEVWGCRKNEQYNGLPVIVPGF